MYDYRRKRGRLKRTIIFILFMAVISASSIYIYKMYANIDIYSQDEETNVNSVTRLSQNITEETNKKEEDITNILENVNWENKKVK